MVTTVLMLTGMQGAEFGKWEFNGFVEAETRIFPESPLASPQFETFDASLALEPELYRNWESRDLAFTLKPFFRFDAQDEQRTHFDLRELLLHKSANAWELKLGVSKVFWGVTESNHLIDVINQTDLVENIDLEEKLGQPMLNFTWLTDFGTWDAFYLPFFRERTFPGVDGRLRPVPAVDTDNPIYESDLSQWHPDFSLRWAHVLGEFDLGLSYFYGTSRDPLYQLDIRPGNAPVFQPIYNLMHQAGLDVQWTHDSWLWKLEGLYRSGLGQHFQAAVGGFEYTFYGLFNSDLDLGVLTEYNYDSRGNQAITPFNHDLFAGARLTLNDTQDTALLAGGFYDTENSSSSLRLEIARRLGSDYTVALEGQYFIHTDREDFTWFFQKDSFLLLSLRHYW